MLLKNIIKPMQSLTTIPENMNLQTALDILEDTGFRCIPVLDQTNKIFRGNIYKSHIYKHKSENKDMLLPVTTLLKNSTKFIHLNDEFFKVFFSIKDLPYIAVLDEQEHFYGILTHTRLLEMLSQSWNVNMGSYVLSVLSKGERGDLTIMSKIITKYSAIASCITLNIQDSYYNQRTLFTLPQNVDNNLCQRIQKALKRRGFIIDNVEKLDK